MCEISSVGECANFSEAEACGFKVRKLMVLQQLSFRLRINKVVNVQGD